MKVISYLDTEKVNYVTTVFSDINNEKHVLFNIQKREKRQVYGMPIILI